MKIGLNSKPSNIKSLTFGLQHILTMLGATVAVPTIICNQLGLSNTDTAAFISNVLLAMGISTFIQVKLGSKLPIIQGSSFAFLPPLLLIASQDYSSPEVALQHMMGAIIIGSVLQITIGLTGMAGRIQRILSPVVVGPIILVIGLSLFPVGTNQASTYWPIAVLAMALIFFFSYSRIFHSNSVNGVASFIGSIPVLASVIISSLVCFLLSSLGFFDDGHAASIGALQNTSLIPSKLPIFTWGLPKFEFSFMVVMFVAYIVSIFESIGDYNAIAEISQDEENKLLDLTSEKRINSGILFEGFGCLIAGIIGANPTTSYSENIGLIGVTKISSRFVIVVASFILVLLGIIPIFGSILSSIPTPVMGGLYCVLFGMVTGVGVRITSKSDTNNMRNITIIGFTLFMAFCVPQYFSNSDVVTSISNNYSKTVSDLVSGVLGSNMAVATLVGLVLDNIIPKIESQV